MNNVKDNIDISLRWDRLMVEDKYISRGVIDMVEKSLYWRMPTFIRWSFPFEKQYE